MKLIFDWAKSFYETKEIWRSDAEIISIEISHRECGFASAKVLIHGKIDMLSKKKYVKIGVQVDEKNPKIDLLFTGRLISFPVGFGNSCFQLELIAEPHDYQQQLSDFLAQESSKHQKFDNHSLASTNICFDDLFFSEKDITENPTVFLEGDTKHFYWDARSGKLSLTDINCGNKNIEIRGDEILQDSLRIRLAREPYSNVKISISADWIQHSYGCIDLFPMIASKFKNGIVSSYTNIRKGLEKLCDFSQKNGYSLFLCKINEVVPSKQSLSASDLPLASGTFEISDDNDTNTKTKVRFRRFYFDGSMLINWNYKQKRIEMINVNLVNTKNSSGREKKIRIKLNSIQLPKYYPRWRGFSYFKITEKIFHNGFIFECTEDHFSSSDFDEIKWRKLKKIPDALPDDSSGSFFATNRGKNAIRYALQKAHALVNYSSRYVEITFIADAKNFLFATIDNQITISDSRFKNGKVTGKITKTSFIGNSNHKIVRISMACCNFDGIESEENDQQTIEAKLNEYFSKLQLQDNQVRVKPDDIITGIEVHNPPEEQEVAISKKTFFSVSELESQLKQYKTKIKIHLHSLSTARVIVKNENLPDFFI